MGFLEKMGLVERVPKDETEEYETEEVYTPGEEVSEVEAASVDEVKDTLIEDIYAKNNLTDMSASIFKVEDVMKSLPMEMATETKRGAVLGILTSFNLTSTDVTEDGEKRIEVLKSVQAQIEADNNAEISLRIQKIEDLKFQIENLNKEVSGLEESTKTSNELITAEVKKVQSLVDFIIGGNK